MPRQAKRPGEKARNLPASASVPEKYSPQSQPVLAVTGLAEVSCWSFRFQHAALLRAACDKAFISELRENKADFWTRVRAVTVGRGAATSG